MCDLVCPNLQDKKEKWRPGSPYHFEISIDEQMMGEALDYVVIGWQLLMSLWAGVRQFGGTRKYDERAWIIFKFLWRSDHSCLFDSKYHWLCQYYKIKLQMISFFIIIPRFTLISWIFFRLIPLFQYSNLAQSLFSYRYWRVRQC